MTVVESFSRSPIQNIANCLALKPDKVILVGEIKLMEKSVPIYKKILRSRGLSKIKIVPKHINTDDFKNIKEELEKIVNQEDSCVFDLCGGDSLVHSVAGIVYAENKDTHSVTLHEIDLETCSSIDLDGDGRTPKSFAVNLTVREMVELCGGSVTGQTVVDKVYSVKNLELLWQEVKKDSVEWNKKISLLIRIEKYADKNGLSFKVDATKIFDKIDEFSTEFIEFKEIIDNLQKCKVLKIVKKTDTEIVYRYDNEIYYNCIRKQGNALEYKTYLEARDFLYNGKKAFYDVKMSVTIDWDGIIHKEKFKDTNNEIDVMVMQGMTPIFISCKNGDIEEEFYKLNVVAERFGSGIAKKVLIATDFNPKGEGAKLSKILRAKEMGIIFEPDAKDFNKEDWHNFFKKIVEL